MNHRDRRLFFDAILLGLLGATCAAGFLGLRDAISTWTAGPLGIPIWVPIVTTLGGLVSGILVYGIDPESEGHGTDTVVRSFHQSAGRLPARTSFVKLLASAVTIGSGGSAGREGPTALIAAGIVLSKLHEVLRVPRNRTKHTMYDTDRMGHPHQSQR